MNKGRRKELTEAKALIESAAAIIEACRDEEQDSFDSLPENMQNGTQGEAMQTAIDHMGDALSLAEDACGEIEEATA